MIEKLKRRLQYWNALRIAYHYWAFWSETSHWEFNLKLVRELHAMRCEELDYPVAIVNRAWRTMREAKTSAYRE